MTTFKVPVNVFQLVEVTGIKSSQQVRNNPVAFEGVLTIDELRAAPLTLAVRFKDFFTLMGISYVHPDVSMHAGRVARLLRPDAAHRLQMTREGIQHTTVHHTKGSIAAMMLGIIDACNAAEHHVDIQQNMAICVCPLVHGLADQLEIALLSRGM